MQFNISADQKKRVIEGLIEAVEVQLYQSLLSAGYDPSSFDEASYSIPEEAYPMSIFHQIDTQLSKLSELKAALAEL